MQNQLSNASFPTEVQMKAAVDDKYEAMCDHHHFLRLLTPQFTGNPQLDAVNMRKYPKLFGQMIAIALFCTGGTDQACVDTKAVALENGTQTTGKFLRKVLCFLRKVLCFLQTF